jgi:hypothetical protein
MDIKVEVKKVRSGVTDLEITVTPGSKKIYRSCHRFVTTSKKFDDVESEVVREVGRACVVIADDMDRG